MTPVRFAVLLCVVMLVAGCAPRPDAPVPTIAVIVEEQPAQAEAAVAATAVIEPTEAPINALPPTWTPTPLPTVAPPPQPQITGLAPNVDPQQTPLPPPGEQLTFSRNADSSPARDVFVIDLANDITRNLTDNAVSDSSPVWGPDQQRIAFVSERNGQTDLYSIRQDGEDLRQLTDDPAVERLPQWAPNGAYIAFISDAGNATGELYAVSVLGGGSPLRLAQGVPAGAFTWSPESDSLIFTTGNPLSGPSRLYRVGLDGVPPTTLLFASDELETVTAPAWSPD
ncbi:MAG: hypothetical protein AAF787_20360, partial [Chloroflexota bacterium]